MVVKILKISALLSIIVPFLLTVITKRVKKIIIVYCMISITLAENTSLAFNKHKKRRDWWKHFYKTAKLQHLSVVKYRKVNILIPAGSTIISIYTRYHF